MDFPAQPLSDDEEAELGELLAQSGSVPLQHARGVFTALSCEPSLQDPTEWLPLVVGSEIEDQATLKRVFTLLVRDFNVVAQCLQLRRALLPDAHDIDGVALFCKGFMRVVHASKAWQADGDAIELTLPLAVLAGYLKLESFVELLPETEIDEEEWLHDTRSRLPERLARIHGHFEPLRQKQQPARSDKVGRNEPCPCGSGKKYKKCCGLTAT
jgi:uncharacterized protein